MQTETQTIQQERKQSDIMGKLPENKLLLKLALPMILSMLLSALYNVVDSIFVGMISQDALTAVSLAFPIQNLIIALGVGVGVGANALISRALGEKRFKEANRYATNSIFIIAIIYVVFAIVAGTLSKSFISWQTTSQTVIEYGTDYLQICCFASAGLFFSLVFEKILCSTGKTTYAMISQLVGAIVNIILDPILIFGLIGFPALGVKGAAIATVVGGGCSALTGFIMAKYKNKDVSISFKKFRPHGKTIGEIFKIGLPTTVLNAVGSVMTFSVNIILQKLNESAVTIFGIYFKIQSLVFMPLFGLTNAMVPIVAYNYGAGSKKRIVKTVKLAMMYATIFMIFATVIAECFPRQILALFSATPEMFEIGVPAIRILFSTYILVGINVCVLCLCQALGKSVISMICSLLRQLIVLIPAAYVLARLLGLPAVWFSFTIADFFSTAIALFFGIHIYKKYIKPLSEKQISITDNSMPNSELDTIQDTYEVISEETIDKTTENTSY